MLQPGKAADFSRSVTWKSGLLVDYKYSKFILMLFFNFLFSDQKAMTIWVSLVPWKMPTDLIQVTSFSVIKKSHIRNIFRITIIVVLYETKLHRLYSHIVRWSKVFRGHIQCCDLTCFWRDIAGDVQNGHARFSQSEEEVPITMKSNADFSAVQQKLAAKKPFYKGISSVFK